MDCQTSPVCTVPVQSWDTFSHSSEWEGVSKLVTGTVHVCVICIKVELDVMPVNDVTKWEHVQCIL